MDEKKQWLARAKGVATVAALLTAVGSAAALAQGAPPGSPSWGSWPGPVALGQGGVSVPKPSTVPSSKPGSVARWNGPAPVASNPARYDRRS